MNRTEQTNCLLAVGKKEPRANVKQDWLCMKIIPLYSPIKKCVAELMSARKMFSISRIPNRIGILSIFQLMTENCN
jgi:hypothetical protein